jgi:hypothetical protein
MEDGMFKKACEQWHLRFSHSLRKGKDDEVRFLEGRVGRYAEEWRDHLFEVRRKLAVAQDEVERLRQEEASAYKRCRLLAQLFASMKQRIRRAAMEKRRMAVRKLAEKLEHGGDDDTHA